MRYKLVMLDVDGTLLSTAPHASQCVRSAIRRAQDQGVTVGLCTGRIAKTCQTLVEALALDSYSVYYSGTLLKNLITGRVLKKHALPHPIVQEIVQFARAQAIYLELHTEEAYLYELRNSYSDFQHTILELEPIYADLSHVDPSYEILKLQFVTESPTHLDRIAAFTRQNCQHIALSAGKAPGHPTMDFINVIPVGISKGQGIREIAADMGIGLEQVIAIGDSLGDIDALEVAGLGVAMGNAEEAVKERADYVAASVWEAGVAEVLERFVLA
ncbi:Cof-type HAD-IIB family hydrolase [candidate division KSB3 bacterium]|uniref:Cof-type HAD-IIB family hydrolase n=1 Tax=candidate division KSB3 bacterium TaxID=2044937 RepID=A0A9D5JTA0_9BACT|nr:Cof-type HAD-IIB family hydrolase [candidate division KSB3 bacterium]MBD3323695.1 Cof-type HAD-IIB family hydrolase [candidate division KSB3 bacterium]